MQIVRRVVLPCLVVVAVTAWLSVTVTIRGLNVCKVLADAEQVAEMARQEMTLATMCLAWVCFTVVPCFEWNRHVACLSQGIKRRDLCRKVETRPGPPQAGGGSTSTLANQYTRPPLIWACVRRVRSVALAIWAMACPA